jgi:cyclophilin family peptidyl-prolyl cis-trans isomerase
MLCHLHISVAGAPSRRVVLELRPDKCPMTCGNFVALCRSSATAIRRTKRPSGGGEEPPPPAATYRGTEFHRVIPGFMVQGGDYESFDGTGGRSAPSTDRGNPTFPDEDFSVKHDGEGVLSMANRGRDTNGSQFFITLGRAPHLDGRHLAFGRVIRGMEVIRDASHVDTEGGGGAAGGRSRCRGW